MYKYSLSESLKKGPVVPNFFLAAYSEGFSQEAHEFAEAIEQFESLGATVVGVPRDDIGTLTRFSVQVCQSRFAGASDESGVVTRPANGPRTQCGKTGTGRRPNLRPDAESGVRTGAGLQVRRSRARSGSASRGPCPAATLGCGCRSRTVVILHISPPAAAKTARE